ncbi:PAS domain-containing protein [Streptomyces sp. NPDC002573]|uniref:PAS domain-containing protein n=1 Tax=Streptomyces sp. NPDC002573 TaxID=3364651 RepID=UPI00367B37D8
MQAGWWRWVAVAQSEAVSPGEGAAVLEALFCQSPTGLLILDTELRILRINLTRPVLHEAPTEQIVGRHVTDMYDLSAPDEVEAMLYSVLENGAPHGSGSWGCVRRAHRGRSTSSPSQQLGWRTLRAGSGCC